MRGLVVVAAALAACAGGLIVDVPRLPSVPLPPAPAYVMGGRLPRPRSPGTRAKRRWKRLRRRRG